MHSIQDWAVFLIIMVGHLAICCAVYNQTHASASPRATRKTIEKFIVLFVIAVTILLTYWNFKGNRLGYDALVRFPIIAGYEIGCLLVAALVSMRWIFRRLTDNSRTFVVKQSSELQDVSQLVDGKSLLLSWDARLLGTIPLNQATMLATEFRTFKIKRLPVDLEHYKIALISDLHFTGKIAIDYFKFVVQRCNDLKPDLVCICGDIVDELNCIDWIGNSLSNLTARDGVFYVLGNHDRRIVNTKKLRDELQQSNIRFAGNTWSPINVGNSKLMIAGNELPWHLGAQDLSCATEKLTNEFYLLMSHSPDQIGFAHKRGVDLMLAGHTHGGQIRFPVIGPIVAPSRHGVKFASGSFKFENTLMHVSRGISGDDVIRINCPPELTLIELTSGSSST